MTAKPMAPPRDAAWPRLMTRDALAETFRRAGVRSGMAVMVHASLSGLGYLPNGPYDVIHALLDLVGPQGTLLVPTHSGQLTDPADWRNPPVPAEWIEPIRAAMEPFDPASTPVRNRGLLPEFVLRMPGVHRSPHPLNSVAAIGAGAARFTATHPLDESEGVGSPCHTLYESNGHVLLLGVGLDACTALHTAEFLADSPYLVESRMNVLVGRNEFRRLRKYPGTSAYFEKLRPILKASGALTELSLGVYPITLVALAPAVEAALTHMKTDPDWLRTP
jgi:aminoglycoside 3-N-acetyltransferase